MIASGSDDLRICLWNWSNGKWLLSCGTVHTGNIFQVNYVIRLCSMSKNVVNILLIIISKD